MGIEFSEGGMEKNLKKKNEVNDFENPENLEKIEAPESVEDWMETHREGITDLEKRAAEFREEQRILESADRKKGLERLDMLEGEMGTSLSKSKEEFAMNIKGLDNNKGVKKDKKSKENLSEEEIGNAIKGREDALKKVGHMGNSEELSRIRKTLEADIEKMKGD